MDMLFVLCVVIFMLRNVCSLCTYPSEIRGVWTDSVYDEIEFSNSWMNMRTQSFLSGKSSTNFTCEINDGEIYVSKSVESVSLGILGGFDVNVWICFEMKYKTASSYYYYLRSTDTANLNFGDVVPIGSSLSGTQSGVCNTSPSTAEFHMLVNSATATSGLSECPVPLLGDFTYTMNFGTATTQCGSSAYWNGCSNTSAITLNNTACGSQFVGYSASGSLGCIVSIQEASVYYVGIYNFDTTVNGASTKRFTCFTVEQYDSGTNVSQIPQKCTSTSNPSTLPTDGALFQLTTIVSCAPVTSNDYLTIAEILAIVLSIMLVIFLAIVIGICLYRRYIRKHSKKIVIIPKQLPRGAHTVFTLSDTSTVVNKEILTEPNLIVKPIRNGQPQSMELQQWKHNQEFQEPEGRLKPVIKPQPPVERIDTMKSRVATQMREESERKQNSALRIDRVRTNIERELRVISVLKAKQKTDREEIAREAAASKISHVPSLAPAKSRMSQYIHDPKPKARTSSMRRNKISNGAPMNAPIDHSFDTGSTFPQRTSTPISVQRPSSIDMVMSEANLSIFSIDKHRATKTPRPQPDITVTKRIKDDTRRRYPVIRELTQMPGEFQSFER